MTARQLYSLFAADFISVPGSGPAKTTIHLVVEYGSNAEKRVLVFFEGVMTPDVVVAGAYCFVLGY